MARNRNLRSLSAATEMGQQVFGRPGAAKLDSCWKTRGIALTGIIAAVVAVGTALLWRLPQAADDTVASVKISLGDMVVEVPAGKVAIGFSWRIIPGTGWGNFGTQLLERWIRNTSCPYYPIIIAPQRFRTPVVDELLAAGRQPPPDAIDRFLKQQPQGYTLPFAVAHSISGAFNRKPGDDHKWGRANIAFCFFEVAILTQAQRHYAASFDMILAGSKYNERVLVEHGITPEHVRTAWQGVDTTLFRGSSTRADVDVETQKLLQLPEQGRDAKPPFVVFSGGKLEIRKGQDIVIAGFRKFLRSHPDSVLVTAWHNYWPGKLTDSIQKAGLVQGAPDLRVVDAAGRPKMLNGKGQEEAVRAWVVRNGIPEANVRCLGPTEPRILAAVLRRADVAVFPNRAEGGTNLVAMEAMASGVPTIMSSAMGHADLADESRCFVLPQVSDAPKGSKVVEPGRDWARCTPSDVVRALDAVHNDEKVALERAARGAAFVRSEMTWEISVARISDYMQERGI